MPGNAVISLTTGLEDSEKVTVAFLVPVGAAESGCPTLMFLAKEVVRFATNGTATGVACDGCLPLAELVKRDEAAGGRYYVCPVCFNAKQLSPESLTGGAELQGTVPTWCGSAAKLRPPAATGQRFRLCAGEAMPERRMRFQARRLIEGFPEWKRAGLPGAAGKGGEP